MKQGPTLQIDAQLVAIAANAIDALAHLDGERLEALLNVCRCMSSEAEPKCVCSPESTHSLEKAVAVLHCLLGFTRGNQMVVERALQIGSRPLEYSSHIRSTFGRG